MKKWLTPFKGERGKMKRGKGEKVKRWLTPFKSKMGKNTLIHNSFGLTP